MSCLLFCTLLFWERVCPLRQLGSWQVLHPVVSALYSVGVTHACSHTWLYMASRVLNSGPCACTTSALTHWVISRARVYRFFSWWPAGWFLPSCCHSSTRFCVIQRGEIPACFSFYCCLQMFGTFCNNVWIVASMCCSYKIKTLEFCWWLHRSCRLLWDYCCLHNVESNLWREDAFPVV